MKKGGETVSIDVNALQLLPEVQDTVGLVRNCIDGVTRATCASPTCIITYCSVPNTTIG